MFEFTICVAVAVGAILAAAFIHDTYVGKIESLSSATIGAAYNFIYEQPLNGTYERFLAKVLSVRHLNNDEVRRLNMFSNYRWNDKKFSRGKTLVTCVLPNGDIRNFYAERTASCKRSFTGGLLYRFGMISMF